MVDSQQGHLHEVSWECIAASGRFVDIGLKDAFLKEKLAMHIFTKNVSYSGTNLAALIAKDHVQLRKVLSNVLALLEAGQLRPVTPIHRYSLGDIETALQFLQSGKSTDKIVNNIDRISASKSFH